MTGKSFFEVQFPIGPISLESFIERDTKAAKALLALDAGLVAYFAHLGRAHSVGRHRRRQHRSQPVTEPKSPQTTRFCNRLFSL
jgi:hypothetical protein